ncbi:sulfofructose kinase [Candidatus Hakubella thermalkaliphila]|uniref:Sulfofructose kinase n=2 Tax=Candidatus Hakubella thermalkaliphila TaxID=2754717 RepID=A0A6V8PT88_9ACTN|nr:PfkB family carbohydrate kinase [Candidatus Hakubella thermalkaliphila]GFP35618.1 sulfofructose kinase [Candidatus Hakubella thermalkaliphila]
MLYPRKYDIVGLGLCCMDYLFVVPRIPAPDEKMFCLDFRREGGGVVSTALVAASRLGSSTSFVGTVGDDENGRLIIEEFERYGVDIDCLQVKPNASSTFSFIMVDQKTAQRSIVTSPGCYKDVIMEEKEKKLLSSASYLHLDSYVIQVGIKAAQVARENSVQVSLDVGTLRPGVEDLLPLVDILITSELFARQLIGKDDPERAAKKMLALGPRIVGITLGDRGCFFLTQQGAFWRPAYRVEVVDTTGAGDVFHGAFLHGLLRGWDLERVADFANAVAALKCTRLGGRGGIPTFSQTMAFLRKKGEQRLWGDQPELG